MQPSVLNNRFALLACGLVMGLGISFYWPHEPLKADASSLDKFSLCTAPTNVNQSDAVFVLDSVTGRLVGAAGRLWRMFVLRAGERGAERGRYAAGAAGKTTKTRKRTRSGGVTVLRRRRRKGRATESCKAERRRLRSERPRRNAERLR